MKETMLQSFQWYSPEDGSFWKTISQNAPTLEKLGYTKVWLPPAYKGQAGAHDVGYGVYDLYDLGEFDQKGSVRTKYGTKDEYLQAIKDLQDHNVQVISDIVFNQRMGADEKERVVVQRVDGGNRDNDQGTPYETDVWTKYTFPERGGKYSDFVWNWTCFTGTDWDASNNQTAIMLFKDKHWDENVSQEQGNFDFIMGDDVDMNADYVRKELYDWGSWYQKMTNSAGYRLDAVKSIDFNFFEEWLNMMDEQAGHQERFAVGEYWSGNVDDLQDYLNRCNHSMKIFDVPLHFHLRDCANSGGNYDVRHLLDQTLSQNEPDYAVAFVDNHDTQPTQALESWVMDWFKPQAYATILLRGAAVPCVFIGDIEGIDKTGNGRVPGLNKMVWIRSHLLGDEIIDCCDDDPQKAAWLAPGDHPVVVLYTIADGKQRDIQHPSLAGRTMVNIYHPEETIVMDENGQGCFHVGGGECSVWIDQNDYNAMKDDLGEKDAQDETTTGRVHGLSEPIEQ